VPDLALTDAAGADQTNTYFVAHRDSLVSVLNL
jgi:hypothetical protein